MSELKDSESSSKLTSGESHSDESESPSNKKTTKTPENKSKKQNNGNENLKNKPKKDENVIRSKSSDKGNKKSDSDYEEEEEYEYEEEEEKETEKTTPSVPKLTYQNTPKSIIHKLILTPKSPTHPPIIPQTNKETNKEKSEENKGNESAKSSAKSQETNTEEEKQEKTKMNIEIPKKEEREEDERIVAYKELLNEGIPPPPHLIAPVQMMLNRAYVRALKTENYDEGIKIDRAMKINGGKIEENLVTQRRNDRMQTIHYRLSQAENDYVNKDKEWKEIFDGFYQEQNQLREELKTRQQQEEDEFANRWGDPSNFKTYNKPSPALLQLRKIQKEYAMARDFENAKIVRKQADDLQKQETENAERRALDAMLLEHQKLEEKHKKEITCFNEKEKRTELFLSTNRQSELRPLEMLIRQLKISINSSKPQNLKPQRTSFQSTARTRAYVAQNITLPPKDRKTVSQLNTFRNKDEPVKLELSGFDVKKLMRRPKSTIHVIRKK